MIFWSTRGGFTADRRPGWDRITAYWGWGRGTTDAKQEIQITRGARRRLLRLDRVTANRGKPGRGEVATRWGKTDAKPDTMITSGAGRRVLGLDLVAANRRGSGRVATG